MAYAFSNHYAEIIVDHLSQGDDAPSAYSDLYVTLFDDTGDELSDNLTDARVGVSTTDGWTKNGSDFENADEIDLGEASTTLEDVTEAAIFDAESDGNLLLRGELEEAPFNIADGTNFILSAGDISVDVQDFDEQ